MWLFINFVVVSISKSLFHPLISKSILVLKFKGRKTGKKYLIPVSYYEYSEQRLVCVTDRSFRVHESPVVLPSSGNSESDAEGRLARFTALAEIGA